MRLRRGRRRKSAPGRISRHSAATLATLVKNRWPPMSNRQPSRSTVRLIPPTTSSASSTVTSTRARASSWAAVRPAGPPPTITTSGPLSAAGISHRPRAPGPVEVLPEPPDRRAQPLREGHGRHPAERPGGQADVGLAHGRVVLGARPVLQWAGGADQVADQYRQLRD